VNEQILNEVLSSDFAGGESWLQMVPLSLDDGKSGFSAYSDRFAAQKVVQAASGTPKKI
jgi:hypothetical protein